jgi:hypothetical protein
MRAVAQLLAGLRVRHERRIELQTDSSLLRPGLWIVERRLARHWRTDLPDRLIPANRRRPTRSLRPSDRVRRAIDLVFALDWVPRTPAPTDGTGLSVHHGRYSIRLPHGYSPEAVLFDLEHQAVLRVARGPVAPARIEVPQRLARHLGIARFDVIDGGCAFLEEFVDGTPLTDVTDPERRLDVLRRLFAGYTRLVAAERGGSAGPLVEGACTSATSIALPHGLRSWFDERGEELRARSRTWPLVPSHTDLTGTNLLVQGREPRLIDLEWADFYPFFYDVTLLVLREAAEEGRGDLLAAYLDGGLAAELAGLCTASGNPGEDPIMLLMATLLVRCHRAASQEGALDEDRFRRYVERLWAPLEAHTGRLS